MTTALPHHRFDGPDDAPVLVLSPSLGSTLEVWDEQIPHLTTRWRVLRYDLRGHGGSPLPAGTSSVGDLASDVLALVDSYGIDRFAVGGVSLGGAVALWLGLHVPERVTALLLSCTSPYFGPPAAWHDRAAQARTNGMDGLAEAVIARWFTPAYPDRARVARVFEDLRTCPPEGYAACCDALATYDLRDRLADVRVPTLVIGADEDPSTPPAEHAEVLAAGIPGARLVIIEGAAHLAIIEKADDVAAAIAEDLAI